MTQPIPDWQYPAVLLPVGAKILGYCMIYRLDGDLCYSAVHTDGHDDVAKSLDAMVDAIDGQETEPN